MMNSQELETARRLELNLVVLIVQDDAYGMIRWKQAADGFPDFGLTFGNPDFVAYAKAFGLEGGRQVESADSLAPALEAAFGGGGVHLVTVPVDYSENMRVLVDELRAHAFRNESNDAQGSFRRAGCLISTPSFAGKFRWRTEHY